MYKKPRGYWTYEKCQEEALKYNTKIEFSKKSSSAYSISHKKGWIDKICNHMENIGNKYKRCIYSYEFDDKSVYIGLTYNLEKRHKQRLKDNKDAVTIHINNTGLKPKRKKLTDYIDVKEDTKLEKYYVNKYKENEWNILNRIKTGGIGGNKLKWTKEKCQEEALKYKTRTEFKNKSGGAYNASYLNGWLDNITNHMIKGNLKWTKEKCQEEALKYNSRCDFQKKSPQAYKCSLKYKIMDNICYHMKRPVSYKFKWTKEKCQEEALKYNSRSEFQIMSSGAYLCAMRNNFLNEICEHMKRPTVYNKKWTKEKCQEEALKYNTKIEFLKNNESAYRISQRNKWLDEICYHMINNKK